MMSEGNWQGRATWLQKIVRWFWRRASLAPLTDSGMTAAQDKIVRLTALSPPLSQQTPARARRSYRLLDEAFTIDRLALAKVSSHSFDGRNGAVGVRTYHSQQAAQSQNNAGLVYFHGGGCVIGDLDTHDRFCRVIAHQTDMVVISVDYHLAPEHCFPAAIEDAIEGWNWSLDNAVSLNIDVNRLGVGGDSAGGYLSVSVCHQALAPTLSVVPKALPNFQWLIYPWVDCRMTSESSRRCVSDMLLTRDTMTYFAGLFFGAEDDPLDPTVSPVLATSFAGLPPTYVATAGFDPLEDEGKLYAQQLREAGCRVSEDFFAHVMHGFIGMGGVCPLSRRHIETLLNQLVALAGDEMDHSKAQW
nr:esterase [uncultured bacterium]